ncbi:MAG: hypothetical protein EOP84_08970 [Verrucomicrobiaceae bacterium]|nr:MAG: hypothetical protein EOP84_08970 [Verrucomicrobiaceae bacterium]
MTILPKSKAAKIRASIIVAILVWVCFYRNVFSLWQLNTYEPRDGDIVFQSLPHGELVDAIEGVTQSPWSHCGVVMRFEGGWEVVEAIGHVRRTPLSLWIMRGRSGRFVVYRPKPSVPGVSEARFQSRLASALTPYMGRPYDYRYAPEDREIYCSELVFKAYRDAFGVEIGRWEELGQLNWKPFEAFIRTLENGPVPLQRPMITPVGLTRSDLVTQVYPAGS